MVLRINRSLCKFLNKCEYCVQHHFAGLKKLLNDDKKAVEFWKAVQNGTLNQYFDECYLEGINYARKLTLTLEEVKQDDIERLKVVGFSEGEILEINQVTSYFNYVNRMVVGLGVNIKGDVLGLSPNENDNPSNWEHQ